MLKKHGEKNQEKKVEVMEIEVKKKKLNKNSK